MSQEELTELPEGNRMSVKKHYEGLKLARLIMVLSSMSPLFLLWGIRGNDLISDKYFLPFCGIMVIFPYSFLGLRIWFSKKQEDCRELIVGKAEDHRNHVLVYLFAMLLPFYASDTETWREFAALLTALVFIIFLFWHLNLHYMNLIFALLDYHVFTIQPPVNHNPISSRAGKVLITHRVDIPTDEKIIAYRLSDTVFLEVKK